MTYEERKLGMAILMRAEGYCLHRALAALSGIDRAAYQDASNILHAKWVELWRDALPWPEDAPVRDLDRMANLDCDAE